ncbi:MAG: heme-copper oxidase subunit III [Actinobacteria bacterium]|nr:MAG: heme-copper oxidase subunit III [Actinomycetota bacterium]
MTTVAYARRATEPTTEAAPRSASNGWWGMVLLVATEGTLFAVLLASYFYVRFKTSGGWPPDGIADPKLLRAFVMTVLLTASSFFMYAAESGIRRGRQRALVLGLGAAFLLGLAFLGLQIWETVVVARELTPRTDAYGSLFFTVTGAHSAHLVAGLLLMAWIQVRAWFGVYSQRRHLGVQMAAIYWYFVVAVQLAIFVSLYLTPRI